jgi:hypothetical protein
MYSYTHRKEKSHTGIDYIFDLGEKKSITAET